MKAVMFFTFQIIENRLLILLKVNSYESLSYRKRKSQEMLRYFIKHIEVKVESCVCIDHRGLMQMFLTSRI